MSNRPAVLVTGGAGYIGSHCCRALDAAGYRPVCYDNFSTGHQSFVTGALVTGDIADKATLARAFAEQTSSRSCISPHRAWSANPWSIRRNITSTTSPARWRCWMRCARPAATAWCFRRPARSTAMPTARHCPKIIRCAPINPYGASKWMIERVLADYRTAYGLGSFALRYFNASGADPAGGIGEQREVETHLIPRAMMALQGHVPDFAVFGDDYATPDGTAIRDYIHVTDLAAAHVLALKLLLAGHSGGVFNLGTGKGFSVREILAAIASETGREVPHVVKRAAPATRPIWSPMLPPRARP